VSAAAKTAINSMKRLFHWKIESIFFSFKPNFVKFENRRQDVISLKGH